MKMMIVAVGLSAYMYLAGAPQASAQDCSDNRTSYQQLAPQLLVRSQADALRLTPEVIETPTERAHDVLKQSVLSQLRLGRTNTQIAAYLRCVQAGPGTYSWSELTNAPQAFHVAGFGPRVFVSYWIVRGGEAIPNVMPYVDVYRRGGTAWEYETSYGADFVGSSFFIQTEHTKSHGNVILLSGFHIGDPETPFRIEIMGAKESKPSVLYLSPFMARTRIVKVTTEDIFLEQSDTHVGVPLPPLPGTLETEQDPSKAEIHRSKLAFADILNH